MSNHAYDGESLFHIVDDETFALVHKRKLEANGYNVRITHNLKQGAWKVYAKLTPYCAPKKKYKRLQMEWDAIV